MKVYIDPYMDNRNGVLKNKKGIKNRADLEKMEADFTSIRMKQLIQRPVQGEFDFQHLCRIHERIFGDVYDWAGIPRMINIEKAEEALGGLSVEYANCDEIQREAGIVLKNMNAIQWEKLSVDEKAVRFSECMADLWKVHPFREGNTRTTITFCCDFAESRGFGLDRALFRENSVYVRKALVAASARFSDLGDLSKPEYLIRIVKDGMLQHGEERTHKSAEDKESRVRSSSHSKTNKKPGRVRCMDDYFLER